MRHASCRARLAAMKEATHKRSSVSYRFPHGWAVGRCRALAGRSRSRLAGARQRDRAGARPAAAPVTSRPVRPQPARSKSSRWPYQREHPNLTKRLPPTSDRRATRKRACGAAGNERRLMYSITLHQRHEQRFERVPRAARRQSLSARCDWVPRSHCRSRQWALVQVWNGAVLASFDDETSARRAMSWADDDEVVVLYVRS